jgi:hypothetical protein
MGKTRPRMTTRKTTKRKSDLPFDIFRHLLPPFGHLTCMRLLIAFLVLPMLAGSARAVPGPAEAGAAPAQAGSHAHDFVIFATVFTEKGFALPGAKVRVRREDEKKFRWDAMSDRRGELGIRVPQGAEYELTIEARGFKSQARKIDARDGNREDLTLQMELLAGGKP